MSAAGGALTLAVEASTYTGSVALARGGALLAEAAVAMRGREQERLMPAVAGVLAEAGVAMRDIERVVCGAGPGSFTSLRIAAAIAKGLAYARGCPLVPVSSLALMVAALEPPREAGRCLAVLDALRGERYVAECEVGAGGEVTAAAPARVVPADWLGGASLPVVDAVPHARGVVRLGGLLARTAPADLDAWEPDYGRLAEAQVRWEQAHGRPLPRG